MYFWMMTCKINGTSPAGLGARAEEETGKRSKEKLFKIWQIDGQ